MNIALYAPCGTCNAPAGEPCTRYPHNNTERMEITHHGRPLIVDVVRMGATVTEPEGITIKCMATTAHDPHTVRVDLGLERMGMKGDDCPGIPAGPPAVQCPNWCTSHERIMPVTILSADHEHVLLELSVLDEELTTDVPVRVLLRQEPDQGTAARIALEIGHGLYQPTGVVLSRSDATRVAAALLTANVMLVAA